MFSATFVSTSRATIAFGGEYFLYIYLCQMFRAQTAFITILIDMNTTVKQALITFGLTLLALVAYEKFVGPMIEKKLDA